MKLLITRAAVIAADGGVRAFVPGLTVEVDAATAQQILAQQAGVAVELAQALPAQAEPVSPTQTSATANQPRRRKSADAET
ncbi:hypothetical protein Tther_02601 [Tepidimonas thermarum]|uniref:Uncharacterized protein n=1 Tax=Tepidimonas thermarum TaxID=335431 RepID=A0A554WP13_9BURK|nr:hypothetical protein [Tepidimonas thermarum]TSE25321.1 hypothetical protein Tther_02601 [Tepidimonas thermarum]